MGAALSARALRIDSRSPYRRLVGVGGIGTGVVFALEGDHDLGRNESRPGRLLDVRDYCKLHIIAHYPAVLLGARPEGSPFHVLPVGKLGADEAGGRLRREMTTAGMDLRFVEQVEGRPTLQSACFLYPDGSGGNVTTSNSAADLLGIADVEGVAALLDRKTIALAAPEAPLESRLHLLKIAGSRGAFRVASLASAEIPEAGQRGLLAHVDLLALNEDEASTLAGRAFDADAPRDLLDACATAVGGQQPPPNLILTAGRHGAYGYADGVWTHCPSLELPVASSAGAGDALLGGVLAALAAGVPFTTPGPPRTSLAQRPLESALELGACLAAYSVTSPHTIPEDVSLERLLTFAREHGVTFAGPLREVLR